MPVKRYENRLNEGLYGQDYIVCVRCGSMKPCGEACWCCLDGVITDKKTPKTPSDTPSLKSEYINC
jgi:hypothetical protein